MGANSVLLNKIPPKFANIKPLVKFIMAYIKPVLNSFKLTFTFS
jgi:hypothetical protein